MLTTQKAWEMLPILQKVASSSTWCPCHKSLYLTVLWSQGHHLLVRLVIALKISTTIDARFDTDGLCGRLECHSIENPSVLSFTLTLPIHLHMPHRILLSSINHLGPTYCFSSSTTPSSMRVICITKRSHCGLRHWTSSLAIEVRESEVSLSAVPHHV
jgi:hypothetical protein